MIREGKDKKRDRSVEKKGRNEEEIREKEKGQREGRINIWRKDID